jgi:hypothetical protein
MIDSCSIAIFELLMVYSNLNLGCEWYLCDLCIEGNLGFDQLFRKILLDSVLYLIVSQPPISSLNLSRRWAIENQVWKNLQMADLCQ